MITQTCQSSSASWQAISNTMLMTRSMTSLNTTTLQVRSMMNWLWIRRKFKRRNQNWWTSKQVIYYTCDHLPTTCISLSQKKILASSTSAFQITRLTDIPAKWPTTRRQAATCLTPCKAAVLNFSTTRLRKYACRKTTKLMKSTTEVNSLEYSTKKLILFRELHLYWYERVSQVRYKIEKLRHSMQN